MLYDFKKEALCDDCMHRAPLGEFALAACQAHLMMTEAMGVVETDQALEAMQDLVHDTANELVKLEQAGTEGEGPQDLGRKLKLLGALLDDQKLRRAMAVGPLIRSAMEIGAGNADFVQRHLAWVDGKADSPEAKLTERKDNHEQRPA